MLFSTILTYTTLKNENLKNLPPLIELTCSKKYDATVSGRLFVDTNSNQSTFLEYLGKRDIVINSKIKEQLQVTCLKLFF